MFSYSPTVVGTPMILSGDQSPLGMPRKPTQPPALARPVPSVLHEELQELSSSSHSQAT